MWWYNKRGRERRIMRTAPGNGNLGIFHQNPLVPQQTKIRVPVHYRLTVHNTTQVLMPR